MLPIVFVEAAGIPAIGTCPVAGIPDIGTCPVTADGADGAVVYGVVARAL
jgi:hypothetical protein